MISVRSMNRYLKKPMSRIEHNSAAGEAQSAPPTLILAHSSAWQAALKRTFGGLTTVWALDESDLVAEAIEHPWSTIVFELPSSRANQLTKLQRLFWPRRQIFVVGDTEIRSSEPSLRSLGIVDVFYAPADLKRLIKLIQRHNQTHQGPPESLETQIERRLPWS